MNAAWNGGMIFGVFENAADMFQALASVFPLITLP